MIYQKYIVILAEKPKVRALKPKTDKKTLTTMDKLRRPKARARREIISLD